jgi:hypothetical protein
LSALDEVAVAQRLLFSYNYNSNSPASAMSHIGMAAVVELPVGIMP